MRVILFQKIHPDAITPTKAHENDACWDLYSCENIYILPGHSMTVKTGLRFEVLPGEKLHIYSRSGLAAKHSVYVLNAPGVIDAGYTGEIKVILYNAHKIEPFAAEKGAKIAQFSREIVLDDNLQEGIVDENTARGNTGFGSSGI